MRIFIVKHQITLFEPRQMNQLIIKNSATFLTLSLRHIVDGVFIQRSVQILKSFLKKHCTSDESLRFN